MSEPNYVIRVKRTESLVVKCKPEEKKKWFAAFPDGNVSEAVRQFLNNHPKVKALKL